MCSQNQRVILDEMDFYLQIPQRAGFTLQHSIFTAMQGDPDITHNAQRRRASSPHPFRQSSHIAGVAKDGGGESDAGERREMEEDMDDTSCCCL